MRSAIETCCLSCALAGQSLVNSIKQVVKLMQWTAACNSVSRVLFRVDA
jgi:hypothetical protein